MEAKGSKAVNRWLIAAAGVLLQMCLGTVYGWSVFTKPLEVMNEWNRTEVTLAFTIAIGAIGISAAFGGMILNKIGPRFLNLIAAVLFGIGTALTGLAVDKRSLALMYITYGFIGGTGIGMGYVTPISVLVKWFPDRRGLVTGMAIMGFGFGAFFMTSFTPSLIDSIGISYTFYLLGLIFFIIIMASSIVMVNPPASMKQSKQEQEAINGDSLEITLSEAIRMKQFWFFWLMLFVNISAGISLISQASPMVEDIYGQTATQAGIIVGIFSIFNGLGRLIWSAISDVIGRKKVFILLFATQAIVFFIIPRASNLIVFVILACYIYACYGGGFATMPAFAADVFGTKHIGAIYGWILTAWSAAGVAGPIMYSRIRQATQGYSQALVITGISLIISLLLPIFIQDEKK
ncbi:MAG: OFA family MFS transporter [Clostridiaceae bacterium]|nr:OFA family MFS transporter [Clostridiaceae bacterium]